MKKKLVVLLLTSSLVISAFTGCGSSETKSTGNENNVVSTEADTETEGNAVDMSAFFDAGKGTAENPYQIKDKDQLAAMQYDLTAHYILENDIDLEGVNWDSIGNLSYDDMESSDMSGAFSGSFDGNGHKISNVVYNVTDGMVATGFFGCTIGEVKNVTFENVTASGDDTLRCVGGVIGYGMAGKISGITLTGENQISGINCVGGICGGSGCEITDCTVENAQITVNGDNDFSTAQIIQCDVAECGGLIVGGAFTGNVANCTANGTVTATGNEPVGLGGIAGCMQCMESITGNTATVVINAANGHAIGGLCGYAGMGDDGDGKIDDPCQIKDCSVNVQIQAEGATHVGGLIGSGLYYYGMEDRFNVENCSVTGTIDGAVTPGTVAGRAEGSTITSCSADVMVDGTKSEEQIGSTDKLYMSADQYEVGSEEAAAQVLANVKGTYTELWAEAFADKYDETWKNSCALAVGAENAEESAEMLKQSVDGDIYGQEAVDKYSGQQSFAFDCDFTQNVEEITFDGSKISGVDKNGIEVFSHNYSYVGYDENMGFYEFKSDDENDDEFTYMMLAADTPATTYHIEFRYGSDLEALTQYNSGAYAYWMAAGVLKDCDESMVKNGIQLFCVENLKEEK